MEININEDGIYSVTQKVLYQIVKKEDEEIVKCMQRYARENDVELKLLDEDKVKEIIQLGVTAYKNKKFIERNSIPISLIEKKIEELREKVDGDDYWKYTEKNYLGMQYQIEILQELLDERNNTDEQ